MNKERLLKLADHLEKGNLGHKVFDFNAFNDGKMDKNKCGTNGCAIGECPIVFPDEWEFSRKYGAPKLKRMRLRVDLFYQSFDSAMDFFEISGKEVDFLFIPGNDNTPPAGGMDGLPSTATKEQVANHIRKFVEHGGIYDL